MLFGDPSLRVGGLANRPPSAGTPTPEDITITEGTTYTFNVADYGFTDHEGTPLTYRWDFNGDGTWDTSWISSPTTSHTYSDNTICNVKVQASDGEYQSSICSRRLTVLNVAPVPSAYTSLPFGTGTPPCYVVEAQKQVRFETYIDDPGSDTFTYSWVFGEGATPQTSTEKNPTVTFEGESPAFIGQGTLKTYNITLTVMDDDGGIATYRLTMQVVYPSLMDRLGGILGIMGITLVVVSAAVVGTLVWRTRLGGRGGRERQRPP
jgi:hypothetical protein